MSSDALPTASHSKEAVGTVTDAGVPAIGERAALESFELPRRGEALLLAAAERRVSAEGDDERRSMNQSSTMGSDLTELLLVMVVESIELSMLLSEDELSETPAAGPLSPPVKEGQRSPPVRSGECARQGNRREPRA